MTNDPDDEALAYARRQGGIYGAAEIVKLVLQPGALDAIRKHYTRGTMPAIFERVIERMTQNRTTYNTLSEPELHAFCEGYRATITKRLDELFQVKGNAMTQQNGGTRPLSVRGHDTPKLYMVRTAAPYEVVHNAIADVALKNGYVVELAETPEGAMISVPRRAWTPVRWMTAIGVLAASPFVFRRLLDSELTALQGFGIGWIVAAIVLLAGRRERIILLADRTESRRA
jgi:hypothetical protein